MAKQKMEFRAELKQLMDIIIHSLYSHKEIFLRELISNACDAIDKIRFESLTNTDLLEDNAAWKIKIIPNRKKRLLTIVDNGVGMSRDNIVEHLGTIARSGTKEFLENLQKASKEKRPEMIGQFGVGFYASYMVADKVTVLTRMAGDPSEGVQWESDGQGEFTISDHEKADRGTEITLHLKKEEKEFLEEWKIREIVKKYSDFIEHPIVMDVEKEVDGNKKIVEETLNSRKAIWLRAKSEVKKEEYHEFYKHIAHDFENPAHIVHYHAEGKMDFRALLYIPRRRPFDLFMPDMKSGLQLYVKRVFIMDHCEQLIPSHFRFVKGVVDSSDLSLNVSREILQQDPIITKIRKNLVNKIQRTLKDMMLKQYDDYVKFFETFGAVLKEGIHTDFENRDKLAALMLFESTKTEPGKYVSLDDYVKNMPGDQEDIYYITGESRQELEHSPHLEIFKQRGREVLFMVDPIDEFVVRSLFQYKEKPLKAANQGEVKEEDGKDKKKDDKKFKDLLEFLSGKIEDVKEVRLSGRLTDSASCLVSEEGAAGVHMEKLMKQMGQTDMPEIKRILELNPKHSAVQALQELYDKNPEDPRIAEYGRILYDQALIAEGARLKDPQAFANRINHLLANALTN